MKLDLIDAMDDKNADLKGDLVILMRKEDTKWQNELRAVEKDAPKNITSKEAGYQYLNNNKTFRKKRASLSQSFFKGVLDFITNPLYSVNMAGYPKKLRIWNGLAKTSRTISLTNLLPSFLTLRPMWATGSTGIVWLSYGGDIKKINSTKIHWYDLAKNSDSVLGEITFSPNITHLKLKADYNIFSISKDDQIDVWSTIKRKIIKSFVKKSQALGFGSHYVAWMDNPSDASSTDAGFKINVLDVNSEVINYFYIPSQPDSDIYIYGNQIVLTTSSKFFDYNTESEKLNEVTFDQRIVDGMGLLMGFDGSKLIFYAEDHSRIFVQPIDGSVASEYLIDKAGNFVGYTGKYLVFMSFDNSAANSLIELPNDPFGFKVMKKTLVDQMYRLKKGTAFGIINLYQLP